MEPVKQHLTEFSLEAHDLYLNHSVPYLEEPPDPLQFYRNWIGPNKPCIIRKAFSHWPALSRWTPDYLREKVGSKIISVAVTPNGYADAVSGDRFVMPEERQMSFSSVLDIIEGKVEKCGVFYIQKQCSNLLEELPELTQDVEPHVPWMSSALDPQEVNLQGSCLCLGPAPQPDSSQSSPCFWDSWFCAGRGRQAGHVPGQVHRVSPSKEQSVQVFSLWSGQLSTVLHLLLGEAAFTELYHSCRENRMLLSMGPFVPNIRVISHHY
ncbi:bifunctional peptidase and (3S)-lysyl hydroxylase JMJD7 isoform X4 [Betta splendens]|uniref:Bifunctional peptidase and (3S)-lysyl hydroxylase JMJD7 isoform X4 n=1 Tax=Betta splendens TaxID=158456 RepID=A0A6P7LJF2_BETSP|nr:bifunctional peptidase and (3S)-lysyl hydroxylase JMJD7 isoform X4 [Betta splendens]